MYPKLFLFYFGDDWTATVRGRFRLHRTAINSTIQMMSGLHKKKYPLKTERPKFNIKLLNSFHDKKNGALLLSSPPPPRLSWGHLLCFHYETTLNVLNSRDVCNLFVRLENKIRVSPFNGLSSRHNSSIWVPRRLPNGFCWLSTNMSFNWQTKRNELFKMKTVLQKLLRFIYLISYLCYSCLLFFSQAKRERLCRRRAANEKCLLAFGSSTGLKHVRRIYHFN